MFELYRSHPRLIVVPSTGSFLEKMVVVSQAVAEVLAEPVATASPREAAYLRS